MFRPSHDPERLFDLDMIRCTEHAALTAARWLGKGEKEKADHAATDAINGMFQLIDCRATVRIGEGRKDNAPGLFTGERLGNWQDGTPHFAIAIDPIDGTSLTAKGLPGAISVLAAATCENVDDDPSDFFPAIPSHYMEKIAVGPHVAESLDPDSLNAPLVDVVKTVAGQLEKRVCDLFVVVLDRPRHHHIITTLREADCRVRLIADGDVASAIAPCLPESGVDLYVGMGGSPEAVLAAAAIKSLGGEMLCRIWPRDEDERRGLSESGCTEEEFARVWTVDEMAQGDHIVFAATGISDSPMLRGVRHHDHHSVTESMLIRARHRTLRRIETHHDLRHKTIRLASTGDESLL